MSLLLILIEKCIDLLRIYKKECMKILAPYAYFAPEQAASSYLWQNLHEDFAKAGMDCIIYVPTPTRGVPVDIRKTYKKKYTIEKLYNGKLIIHRFLLYGEGKNPFMRAFRYLLSCSIHFFKCMWGSESKDCNILFIASTPPILGLVGAFVGKFRRIPFIYNLQDIFPDSLVGTGLAKKGGLLWKIGRVIEDFTYKHADKIIVISEDFKKNIMAKGVPEDKIVVVYNWVDENAVVPVAKEDNPLFDEFGISRDKFHVVYAGNLGNAQNIDVIIDAANVLKEENNVEFLIFGTGGLKDQFVAKVNDLKLDNVKFFPLQPMERVSQVYGLGDVCVVSCKPGLGGAAMPSKMLSIMSAGRAVVASFDKGELTYILENHKCGMYAPAGDADAFAGLIKHLAQNREECKTMGDNARKLILQKFTKAYGTSRYVEIIKSVANNK